MADVAASVRQWLVSQSSVSTLIGQRMYREKIPQDATLPCVTLTKISTLHEHKLTTGLAGLARARLQFDAYGSTPASANAVAEAIKDCGLMTLRGTTNGVYVNNVELESGQRTFIDSDDPGSDDSRFVVSQDFMVYYSETAS
jgi:hypothetical protein